MATLLRFPVCRALQLVLRQSNYTWQPRVQSLVGSAACLGSRKDRRRRPLEFSEEELRQRLTPVQYRITQEAGTERAYTGEFTDHKDDGTYACVVCGTALFSSDKKFDSGSGWPSFFDRLQEESITLTDDFSCGMHRVEASCAQCGAHLGHVFDDGPAPKGKRYCINSAALAFWPGERGQEGGAENSTAAGKADS